MNRFDMRMSAGAVSDLSMFDLTMAKARVIMIVLVPVVLPNCEARESDAEFWWNEREIIELAQRLKLCEYRLGLSHAGDAGKLDELKVRLTENEVRLSNLQSEKASLASEVQSMETRNKELGQTLLQQRRLRARGMKFETLMARDGRIFNNATIIMVDDAGVDFRHEHGAARLRYAELSDERRLFFGLEESTALAAQDREHREVLAYERRIDLELDAIREREAMASAFDEPEKTSRISRSLVSASFPLLETGKLAEPAKPFGSGPSYRRYHYSGYRSYRPGYRSVFRYSSASNFSCPSHRTHRRSSGYSSSACPSVIKTP